jgi:hypothetical protein
MNFQQDRFAEILLPLFDALMNIITLGIWGAVQGMRRPNLKVRK